MPGIGKNPIKWVGDDVVIGKAVNQSICIGAALFLFCILLCLYPPSSSLSLLISLGERNGWRDSYRETKKKIIPAINQWMNVCGGKECSGGSGSGRTVEV
jgi:hypothetical protein